MTIKKNKDGTYDLKGVTFGKLLAIVHSLDSLEAEKGHISPTAADVRDLIKNNPDYRKDKL